MFLGLWIASLSHNLFDPLSQDQALYQYMAERAIAGDRLYVDVWDQNAPGIIAIHWLATHVAGRTSLAFRVFDAGWQAVTLAVLILLVRRDGRRYQAAWLAASLYVLAYYGTGYISTGQREGFAVLPMLLAVHAMGADRQLRSRGSPGRYFLAGVLLSFVFAIKPPLGLTFGVLWTYTLVGCCRPGSRTRPADAIALTLGFLVGVAVGVALIVHIGSWSAFWPTFTRAKIPGYIHGPRLMRDLAGPFLLGSAIMAGALWPVRRHLGVAGKAPETGQFSGWLKTTAAAIAVMGLLLTVLRWPTWQPGFTRLCGLLIPAIGAILCTAWTGRSRVWQMQALLAGASLGAFFLQGQFFLYQLPPLLVSASCLVAYELTDRFRDLRTAPSAVSSRGTAWMATCLACVTTFGLTHWGRTMTFPFATPCPLSGRSLMEHYHQITKHRPSMPTYDTSAAVGARIQELTMATDRVANLIDDPRLLWLSRRPTASPLIRPSEVYRNLFPEFLAVIRQTRPKIMLARIPEPYRAETDRSKLETAIADWAASYYGQPARAMCEGYRITDVIDDVCILQPREARPR